MKITMCDLEKKLIRSIEEELNIKLGTIKKVSDQRGTSLFKMRSHENKTYAVKVAIAVKQKENNTYNTSKLIINEADFLKKYSKQYPSLFISSSIDKDISWLMMKWSEGTKTSDWIKTYNLVSISGKKSFITLFISFLNELVKVHNMGFYNTSTKLDHCLS